MCSFAACHSLSHAQVGACWDSLGTQTGLLLQMYPGLGESAECYLYVVKVSSHTCLAWHRVNEMAIWGLAREAFEELAQQSRGRYRPTGARGGPALGQPGPGWAARPT